MYGRLKRGTHLFLDSSTLGDKAGMAFDYFMIALIVANVFAIILETVDSIFSQSPAFFFWFEVASVAIFTVEYVLRTKPQTYGVFALRTVKTSVKGNSIWLVFDS
ncbi:MAG: hypothetical protein CMM10_13370 [Rhodospirillaceae bacterium]|jgi:voltage-gated potassium channel|nr:hypothetical protein [Rhodospirillaceae bacterium]|tara:strand:+ start:628 stop:942 length:315 start_codon:yes stop_codon:yes gene_type:complete